MNDKNTGGLLIAFAIVLAILYLAVPTVLIYLYWIAVLIFFVYGVYLFLK